MTTTGRQIPSYDIKGGDAIRGREVFDVIDTFGHMHAILFVDGGREEVPFGSLVTVD